MEVIVFRAEWSPERNGIYKYSLIGRSPSVEALPRWIQERYAVLRLLNEHEESALGMWTLGATYTLQEVIAGRRSVGCAPKQCLRLYVVWLPDDPYIAPGTPLKGVIPTLPEGARQ